jgi:Pretoxin HINT domain
LGRSLFLIGFDAGDTNLYRYVNNSPTNFTDPSGMTLSGWGEDLLNGVDSLAAGFANVVTFGLTNKIREVLPNGAGKTAKLNQEGLLYDIGSGLGLAATLALNPAGAGAGWAKGLAAGYEGVGAVYGTLESTGNILKGEGSVWDAANLLPALQVASAFKRSHNVSSAVVKADDALVDVARNTQCFVAGTEIQTLDGTKNIEDIHVGDWVLSDDPNTVGDIEYKQVLNTFVKQTSNLVDIYIDGEMITTTEEHPFWVPDVGWVAAKDLHAGSLLQTKYESWLDVDRVVKHSDTATVYNFEVEGFHTYFVSDLGLLVHNTCVTPDPWVTDNAISIRYDMKTHLADFDGIQQGKGLVSGTHNVDNFNAIVNSHQVKINSVTPHPSVNGLQIIRYQIPSVYPNGPNARQIIPGAFKPEQIKTVYNPRIISDEGMLKLGLSAAEQGFDEAILQNKRNYISRAGGIDFQVYIENGSISGFHPI